MKKIIFTIFVFIIVFLIYFFNRNEKIYYTSIGDYLAFGINNFNNVDNNYSENIKNNYKNNLSNYINYSTIEDYRIMDLINDINYNKLIKYNNKEYKLQNILIKSNYITLSIGMNDILNKKNVSYDYLGFYNIINNKDLIDYTNNRLKKICKENKINYIDISDLNSYILKDIYPTNEGYSYITNQILNFTK